MRPSGCRMGAALIAANYRAFSELMSCPLTISLLNFLTLNCTFSYITIITLTS